MSLIAGGAGKGGQPQPPETGPDAAAQPPGGSPMSTPQPAHGDKQSALTNVSIAGDLLEQTLPALGHETEEGRAVMQVLQTLSKVFGHTKSKSSELAPAELMQLMAAHPMAGGMSPEQKAMGQKPIQVPQQGATQ